MATYVLSASRAGVSSVISTVKAIGAFHLAGVGAVGELASTTTWNPSDKTVGGTLSNGNLTFTATSFGANAVRAVDFQHTGKFYWEVTGSPFAGTSGAVGIATSTYNLNSTMTVPGGGGISVVIGQIGAIYVNGAQVVSGFGSIASGTTVCIAADFGAGLIWFRLGAAGNWNNSATANPATGAGGVSTGGPAFSFYPVSSQPGNTGSPTTTANFGASAFTGAVPTGFTSGFPVVFISPVKFLCHFDGASGSTTFSDTGGYHTLTPTGVTVNTAAPKFGTGAGDFTSSTAACIDTGNITDFLIGAKQFTIEAWAYFTSAPGSGSSIVAGQWSNTPISQSWLFGIVSGSLALYYSLDNASTPSVGIAYTPALNTWIHLAADRDASGVIRVYANGVVMASATVAGAFYFGTTNCLIGNYGPLTLGFLGRLDEARIVVGQAMYGGAFTPPTAPFADGPPSITTALATQVALEEWAIPSPQAQITQVAIEQWATTTSTTTQALVTQAALEMWALVPGVGPPINPIAILCGL